MSIDFSPVLATIEKVENEFEALSKDDGLTGLSKKEIAIKLIAATTDVPMCPEFIEEKLIGLIIDAIVAAYNKAGVFIHSKLAKTTT